MSSATGVYPGIISSTWVKFTKWAGRAILLRELSLRCPDTALVVKREYKSHCSSLRSNRKNSKLHPIAETPRTNRVHLTSVWLAEASSDTGGSNQEDASGSLDLVQRSMSPRTPPLGGRPSWSYHSSLLGTGGADFRLPLCSRMAGVRSPHPHKLTSGGATFSVPSFQDTFGFHGPKMKRKFKKITMSTSTVSRPHWHNVLCLLDVAGVYWVSPALMPTI